MKHLASGIAVAAIVSGIYVACFFAWCPPALGAVREPWFAVVVPRSTSARFCESAFRPCLWVETQLVVSNNLNRAEGAWVTQDGAHSIEVTRGWGNTFQIASPTGWIENPVRETGNAAGCGPMVRTGGRLTLLAAVAKPGLTVWVDGKRTRFQRPDVR